MRTMGRRSGVRGQGSARRAIAWHREAVRMLRSAARLHRRVQRHLAEAERLIDAAWMAEMGVRWGDGDASEHSATSG